MESTIHKIFSGKKDNELHDEFIKFSKGVFGNKYIIDAKKKAEKYSIKTSAEFANYFVRLGLEKANTEIDVSGAIIATFDIRINSEIEIVNVKQFMGVKQFIVNSRVHSSKLISMMNKFPRAFFALSFNIPNYELKIKAKAPKSAKPSTKGEAGPKADFCSLKTANVEIAKDLFFDIPDFKQISINHAIQIDEIDIPTGIGDPVKIRESAIRKGKIIRKLVVDGKETVKEMRFEA